MFLGMQFGLALVCGGFLLIVDGLSDIGMGEVGGLVQVHHPLEKTHFKL